jgi:hypothetical protein
MCIRFLLILRRNDNFNRWLYFNFYLNWITFRFCFKTSNFLVTDFNGKCAGMHQFNLN